MIHYYHFIIEALALSALCIKCIHGSEITHLWMMLRRGLLQDKQTNMSIIYSTETGWFTRLPAELALVRCAI